MTSDSELLREFSQTGSESALATFLRRHLDLIFSVAMMRSNGDRALAEEVTQQVSIAVTQQAARLSQHPSVVGWLYTAARNAVIDVRRRQNRERERLAEIENYTAITESSALPETEKLRPFLLEELDRLEASDRELLLLRYFQGQPFAQIAESLYLPEDTVRKRSSRAIDKVRHALETRGLTSSLAVLGAAMAEAMVTAPPALLEKALEAALALRLTGASLLPAAKSVLWPIVGSMAVFATAVLLVFSRSRSSANGDAKPEVRVVSPTAMLPPASPAGRTVPALPPQELDDVALLRRRLAQMPDRYIPEIEILADDDWRSVTKTFSPRSEDNILPALRTLRDRGRARFGVLAADALNRFLANNNGQVPATLAAVRPYFSTPVEAQCLTRYVLIVPQDFAGLSPDQPLFSEFSGVVDEFGDSVLSFGRTLASIKIVSGDGAAIQVRRALAQYAADHAGGAPEKPADLSALLTETGLKCAEDHWPSFPGRTLRSP